jgi:tRNA G10  N-methylase Trm11
LDLAFSWEEEMKPYFATCVTGAEEIVTARLQQHPNGELKVQHSKPGLVMFDSTLSPNQLSELRFFNNVYLLLADGQMPSLPAGTKVTLRARAGSQPTVQPADLLQKLAGAGYEVVAHKPEVELLYWVRDDSQVLWGQMLPRPGFKTRKLEAGELRPELAHILGLVASVDSKDAVVDPFAGYGAIVREMIAGFHCQNVIAVEHNEHLVPHLKSIPNLIAVHGDAGQLAHIETRSIDRVVTDPPWGEFGEYKPDELKKLYHAALIQMHRVLRAKGCAVILSAADFLPELALENNFTIEKQYSILVSGNKATIYKLRKV